MVFSSAYDIQCYLLDCFRKIDEDMKKEYMKKRLIDWCHGHNAVFTWFDNGAVFIHYKEYNSVWCDLSYPSLSYAYKKLIIEQDCRMSVAEFDDDGDKLPF